MKKIVNTAFIYACLGLLAGIFYREFTRWTGYTGESMLSVLHTHLLTLGMLFMLVTAWFYKEYKLEGSKKWNMFFIMYNVGLGMTMVMMLVRGTTQVLQTPLARGADFAIAGIAGLAHIVIAGGIIHFFLAVKEKL